MLLLEPEGVKTAVGFALIAVPASSPFFLNERILTLYAFQELLYKFIPPPPTKKRERKHSKFYISTWEHPRNYDSKTDENFCGLVCVWPFLCLCHPFMIFEGCLDSKPESLL
jgi:hypothetical protein